MSKGLRVRNTLVNGGMTGIDEKIDKVFAYKQGNNYSTAKKRVKASNPNTELQAQTRTAFAETSANWSFLTEAERQAWNLEAPNWTNEDVFGVKKQTGKNLYTGCNIRLVGVARAKINAPGNKEAVASLISGSVESQGGEVLCLYETDVESSLNSVVYSVSPQMNAGYSKAPQLTQIAYYSAGNTQLEGNITAAYIAKYGALVIGKKIFWEVAIVTQGGNRKVLYSGATVITA